MRHWVLAIALFAACAALFSLPASLDWTEVAVGAPESDAYNSLWILWAVPEALRSAEVSLGDFSYLVDPAGANLWPHLGNVLYPVILAPITWWKGPIAAANVGLILVLFLNCFCAYLFLQHVVGDLPSALPPAVGFGVGSFVLAEAAYGNVELAGVFVVPLAAWAIVRSCDEPGWRRALWMTAALLLAALWNAYYGMAVFVFAVLAAGWAVFSDRTKRPLWFTGGALLAASAMLLPVALWLSRQVDAAAPAGGWQAVGAHLDLLEPIFFARNYPNTVPYFLLLLAVGVTVTKRRRDTLFWWVAAGVFFLFALGESIHVYGHDTGLPGPYRLLSWLPGMERARWPYRFVILSQLAVAVIAAHAVRGVLEYLDTGGGRGERRFTGLLVLLALAVSFFLVPHPGLKTDAPEPYGAVHEHGPGAVLELPASLDFHVNSRNLFYQTVHRHPVLAAKPFPDYPPGFAAAAVDAVPALAAIDKIDLDLPALVGVDAPAFRNDLKKLGVRYVALHFLELNDARREPFKTWLAETFGPPVRSGDTVLMYLVR
ncbi:MAG: hypothetical protein P9L99_08285 [Candidatus Lernaella stagnicola]|nr:hypothetical protein [Candidatus Lernaella stagnicola]